MLAFIATLAIFFIFPRAINAQVVINEFSARTEPEWVELYNTSTEPVNLEGWEIADGNTKSTDDLTLSGIIAAEGFLVLEHFKGWLNDGGDTVRLYNNATPSGELIDSITYTSSSADGSISRIPNGTGDFISDTEFTKGEINQTPPTPTSTPTSTPTATSTPTPTSTPTSEPSTSEVDIFTPTPSPQVLSSITKSEPYQVFFQESTASSVLGTQSASPSAQAKTNLKLVGLGLTILAGSILFFRNNPY